MCGIVGALGLGVDLETQDHAAVEAASLVIIHRGPDGNKTLRDVRSVLANTRLAVMDTTERASLPMLSDDGAVRLAYNGEVSNFKELRERLSAERALRTTSDAEVILRLYEKEGISFLRRLSGMFAFCLVDGRRQKAFLVRDFFGITPLFYTTAGRKLFFASEIKALLTFGCVKRDLDVEAFHHFFSLGYIPGEHTPFSNIHELTPGSLLEVDLSGGAVRQERYYRLKYEPQFGIDEAQWAARVRAALSDSVSRHMTADVPVGLTLSGGVDTSSLLALVKEQGKSRGAHTFSIRMAEDSYDESHYQRLMSAFAGTEHHEIVVTPALVEREFDAHLAHLDEPNASGSALPTFLLSREASRWCKVLLSGEGGDEVFNAYETYGAWKWRGLYRRAAPRWLRRVLTSAADRLPVSHRKLSMEMRLKRFLHGAEFGAARAHLYWRHVLTDQDKSRLMPASAGFKPTWTIFEETFSDCAGVEELDRLSCVDLEHYFYGDLMVKNDRMMMAHSVEARFPYMDRKVVELVATIPAAVRMKGFHRRHIQKKAMAGLLPPAILRRSNFGLEMPHSAWFLGPLRSFAENILTPSRLGASGLIDPAAARALWRDHAERRADHGRALWCIIQFVRWFKLCVQK